MYQALDLWPGDSVHWAQTRENSVWICVALLEWVQRTFVLDCSWGKVWDPGHAGSEGVLNVEGLKLFLSVVLPLSLSSWCPVSVGERCHGPLQPRTSRAHIGGNMGHILLSTHCTITKMSVSSFFNIQMSKIWVGWLENKWSNCCSLIKLKIIFGVRFIFWLHILSAILDWICWY